MNSGNPNDKSMDKFFDNLMNDQERAKFLEQMKSDTSFGSERELQSRIDDVIRARFGFEDLPESIDVTEVAIDSKPAVESNLQSLPKLRVLTIAIAATLAAVLLYGAAQYLFTDRSPDFVKRPMVAIYEDSVQQGFKPYYECHDMDRFAGTFQHKLGVRLTLLEMPANRKMLGISYLGGSSRNSVAMLCEANNKPVMVFIDKASNHSAAAIEVAKEEALSVFTRKENGMIFYEVTPFKEPLLLDFVAFLDD